MGGKNTNDEEEEKQTVPLLIDWGFVVPTLFAKKVNAKLRNKEQTLEVPSWITNAINQDGKVEEETLRTGIAEFLKEVGGTKESISSRLILGITLAQFPKVISAVSLIENDPFMQDVMRDVLRENSSSDVGGRLPGLFLADLALLTHNKDKLLTAESIGPLLVAKNNVNLFRDCIITKNDSQ